MIDIKNFVKIKYFILLILISSIALIISTILYNKQNNIYNIEILIKPVPLYDNVFMNYSLFDSIQFNRSKLDSSDLINLVSKELRENQLLQSIAEDYNVESQILRYPKITYPRINPAEGIPEGSMILRVESTSDENIPEYLFALIDNAEQNGRKKIYIKFENYLNENNQLKQIELDKIKVSIKKIITLFENEIRDLENEIRLAYELGFNTPVISQNFAAFGNNYMAGSIVLERRVKDIETAKKNISKLLSNLEEEPVENVVYQIVHEFVRYVDEHSAFSRVGGTGLTQDLINFEIYELINNSKKIKQAIEVLKRSDFDLVEYNKSSVNSWNMKKSIRSYYTFSIILSIFLTLLIATLLEIRKLKN